MAVMTRAQAELLVRLMASRKAFSAPPGQCTPTAEVCRKRGWIEPTGQKVICGSQYEDGYVVSKSGIENLLAYINKGKP